MEDTEREGTRMSMCGSLVARTHACARVRCTRIQSRIESNRVESRSQERRKDEASQPPANHQPRLERSGRPTVDSLESWPRTRTADYVTVRRTTKALLRAPLGRHSYSILDQDGERSTDVRGRGFSLSLGKMRSKIRGLATFLSSFCRVRSISGLDVNLKQKSSRQTIIKPYTFASG